MATDEMVEDEVVLQRGKMPKMAEIKEKKKQQ